MFFKRHEENAANICKNTQRKCETGSCQVYLKVNDDLGCCSESTFFQVHVSKFIEEEIKKMNLDLSMKLEKDEDVN